MLDISAPLGLTFDINRFSLFDGPGIRTTIFLKGCPLKCPWCHNPEGQKPLPEFSYRKQDCLSGCSKCIEVCPLNIDVRTKWNKLDWVADCINNCSKCVEACPTGAIKLIGKYNKIHEIVALALRDNEFYKSSGGGVTLSGGEPLFQGSFIFSLIKELRSQGLHVMIETCGYGDPELVNRLIKYVDSFIIDIKFGNKVDYEKRLFAYDGGVVFHNFNNILCSDNPKIIRFPYIPGHTDSIENISSIAGYLKSIKINNIIRLEVLPYNPYSEIKFQRLGLMTHQISQNYSMPISHVVSLFENNHFQVLFYQFN